MPYSDGSSVARRLWAVVTAAAFILTSFAVVLATAPTAAATTNCSGSVPGAPTLLAVTATAPLGTEAADNGAMVRWTPNQCTPATPVTAMKLIAVNPSNDVQIVSTVSPVAAPYRALLTGLVNGTTYNIQVVADNAAGDSTPSNSVSITPQPVPDAPSNVAGAPQDGAVDLTWTAPAAPVAPRDPVDAPATYLVRAYSPDGSYLAETTPSNATSFTYTGLTNGSTYTFTVAATNGAGNGPQSLPSTAVTPFTVPDAPTGLSATPDNGKVDLSWTTPAFDGGSPITDYQAIASNCVVSPGATNGVTATDATDADGTFDLGTTGTSATPAQPNGVTCDWVVEAINNNGATPGGISAPSNSVTVAAGVPLAPTIGSATADYKGADVTWTAPTVTNGSPVTHYIITAYGADGNPVGEVDTATTSSPTATSYTCPSSSTTPPCYGGLTPGDDYTFTVIAANDNGYQADSPTTDSTKTESAKTSPAVKPYTLPDAPTDVVATPTDNGAVVQWTAPSDDGGDPILEYLVTATCSTGNGTTPYSLIVPTPAVTATINFAALSPGSNLNGKSCTFTVQAGNSSPGNWMTEASKTASTPNAWSDASAIASTLPAGTDPLQKTAVLNDTTITIGAARPPAHGGSVEAVTVNQVNPPGATRPDPSNAWVNVTWDPFSDNGSAITGYLITVLDQHGQVVGSVVATQGSPTTVKNLAYGQSYTFVVAAQNARGVGPTTAQTTFTPTSGPGAPTDVQATPANGDATVTWTPPTSAGSGPIQHYIVTGTVPAPYSDPQVTVVTDGATTSIDVCTAARVQHCMTNGHPYSFTVTAVDSINGSDATSCPVSPSPAPNLNPCGPASAPSSLVTPLTVPGQPTVTDLHPSSSSSMIVTWEPPTDDGGSPVQSYTVTWVVTGTTHQVGTQTFGAPSTSGPVTETIAGLTPGTAYTFYVTATNAAGTGQAAHLNGTVPYDLPSYLYWVKAVYLNFTGAEPSSATATSLAQQLEQGTLTKQALLRILAASPVRATHIVTNLYHDTLGRTPDQGGLDYWVTQIQSGALTVAKVEAAFYSSSEFYQRSGGTVTGWLTALYQAAHLLGRAPDSGGLTYWKHVLNTNGGNRFSIAYRFVQSKESAVDRVTALYKELLDRAPDSGGLRYWSAQILQRGDLVLAQELALSDEYFQKAPQQPYADQP